MTQDEIIEMARQVGIKGRTDEFYSEFCDGVYFDDLEAFAKLVTAKEREYIIQIIKAMPFSICFEFDVIEAIRARGQA
jgi:hypothetical protein